MLLTSKKNKALLFAVLVLAIMILALPKTAMAATPAEELATEIDAYAGLTAIASDSTVTVTGSATGVNEYRTITVPAGVTLDWSAIHSGSRTLAFSGDGTVNITSDAVITHNDESRSSYAITMNAFTGTMNVSGTVQATGGGNAIRLSSKGILNILPGANIASNNNATIYMLANYNVLNVSGGTIVASGSNAISCAYASPGGPAHIIISDGTFSSSTSSYDVRLSDNSVLLVTGGSFSTGKVYRSYSTARTYFVGNYSALFIDSWAFSEDDYIPAQQLDSAKLTLETQSGSAYTYSSATPYTGTVVANLAEDMDLSGATVTSTHGVVDASKQFVRFPNTLHETDVTISVSGAYFGSVLLDDFTTDPFAVNVISSTYVAEASPTSLTFTGALQDGAVPTAQQLTIKNTGTQSLSDLSADLEDGSAFEITAPLSVSTIAVGQTATLSVRPKSGVTNAVSTDILHITNSDGLDLAIPLTYNLMLYNKDDIATINNMIAQNGLGITKWTDGNIPPAEWEYIVYWNNDSNGHRVDRLLVGHMGLHGSLDVTSLSALTELNCRRNQLTSLHLSGLANLLIMDCGANQISSLDLSGLTRLIGLDCDENMLGSLNLSDLAQLQTLGCSDNQLTILDLSSVTKLTDLDCENNRLTSLSLAGLTNLVVIECGANPLTNLDVSDLINLETLSCTGTRMTSLNVAGLTNLTALDCRMGQLTSLSITGLPALEILHCEWNQLTSLDVSEFSNLTQLFCNQNRLVDLTLNPVAPYTTIEAQYNYMENELPTTSVTGKTGDWDGNDFIYLPQHGTESTFKAITSYEDIPTRATISIPLPLTITLLPADAYAVNNPVTWEILGGTADASISIVDGISYLTATTTGSVDGEFRVEDGEAIGKNFTSNFNINVFSDGDPNPNPNPTPPSGGSMTSVRTLSDATTGVTVKGRMSAGAKLTVKDQILHAAGCDACDEIRSRQAQGQIVFCADISLSGSYTGELEVSFPVGDQYNGKTVTILHCNNGEMEYVVCTVRDGIATGKFKKLSPYAVMIGERVGVPDQILVTPPKTGDAQDNVAFVLVAAMVVIAIGVTVKRRRSIER